MNLLWGIFKKIDDPSVAAELVFEYKAVNGSDAIDQFVKLNHEFVEGSTDKWVISTEEVIKKWNKLHEAGYRIKILCKFCKIPLKKVKGNEKLWECPRCLDLLLTECPFCLGEKNSMGFLPDSKKFCVVCDKCQAVGPKKSDKYAAAISWNSSNRVFIIKEEGEK